MTHSLLCLVPLCGFTLLNFSPRLSVLDGRTDQANLSRCYMLIFTTSTFSLLGLPLCHSLSPPASVLSPICLHPAIALSRGSGELYCHASWGMSLCYPCQWVVNMLRRGRLQFLKLVTKSLNLQLASLTLRPPSQSVWQPENAISLIIWIIPNSFGFDC